MLPNSPSVDNPRYKNKNTDNNMDKLEYEIKLLREKFDTFLGDSPPPSEKQIKDSLQNAAVLTGSFYLLTNAFQRVAGVAKLHSGRPFLAASSFGFLSVAISSALAFQINEKLPYIIDTINAPEKVREISYTDTTNQIVHTISDRKFLLNFMVFSVLERKSYLTVIPSSVISVGAHANHGNFLGMFRGSIVSTDATATEKQRTQIQQLGKR